MTEKDLMDRNLTKDVKAYGLESILMHHERVLCVVVRDVVLYYASSEEDEEQLIKRVVLELGLGSNLKYNKKIMKEENITVVLYV